MPFAHKTLRTAHALSMIHFVAGPRDDQRKRTADEAGEAFRLMRIRDPRAKILLSIIGYDEDARAGSVSSTADERK